MLNLDFADTAIIETIATARTIMAIVPNSGTTCVPTISISVASASNGIVTVSYTHLTLPTIYSV